MKSPKVFFEDANVIVLSKPAGMLSDVQRLAHRSPQASVPPEVLLEVRQRLEHTTGVTDE